MLRYVLRRVLLAIPTLVLISMAIFGLTKCQPTDPVMRVYGSKLTERDPIGRGREYLDCAQRLNLQGPAFYFSWTSAAFPDTLSRIYPIERRERLQQLCLQNGNWEAVQAYDQASIQAWRWLDNLPDSLRQKTSLDQAVNNFLSIDKSEYLDTALIFFRKQLQHVADSGHINAVSPSNAADVTSIPAYQQLDKAVSAMKTQKTALLYAPDFKWHGFDNQYHRWISQFLRGDFGYSYVWEKPVTAVLGRSLLFTILINFFSLGLAYILAIPLSIALARQQNTALDRWGSRILLFFYTAPVFVLGTFLMYALATPHGGYSLIKGIGFEDCGAETPVLICMLKNIPQLLLPVLTISIHYLAFLALQMRNSILTVVKSDYIRAARAKGVAEEDIYWSHARRNALFPLITIMASIFPSMFAGSMVVEFLFNYPGMGGKLQMAMSYQDYPVLFTILMFASVLTVVAQILADLLYAKMDPRVRLSE